MPVDQQSVLPSVRGVPWWGAILIATVITAIGAIIDTSANSTIGGAFNFCQLVGCVLAALAVRRRALFTAAAQPPLISFVIALIALYASADQASELKSLILKVLLPIAGNFPWMAITFLVTLVVVVGRWYLTRPGTDSPFTRTSAATKNPTAKNPTATSSSAAAAKKPAAGKNPTSRRADPGTPRAGQHERSERGSARAVAAEGRTRKADAARTRKPRPDATAQAASTNGTTARTDATTRAAEEPRRAQSGARRQSGERTAAGERAQHAERATSGERSQQEARARRRRAAEENAREAATTGAAGTGAAAAGTPRPRPRSAAADLDRYESAAGQTAAAPRPARTRRQH
ncbi:hypothetical protein GYA93_00030 [Gordonia desulfuricans]|uniref:DUF6542 domain-containing protein n=1 Tax=Gordonia desulfuricans TaxID=89051 RepID=A0A7K3LI90_9ACTN|nr:hypothetical protein [Gordonia desulfuricans]